MGEARSDALRVGFDRAIKLEFHGAKVSSAVEPTNSQMGNVDQYIADTRARNDDHE